jgi:hypothetical protein
MPCLSGDTTTFALSTRLVQGQRMQRLDIGLIFLPYLQYGLLQHTDRLIRLACVQKADRQASIGKISIRAKQFQCLMDRPRSPYIGARTGQHAHLREQLNFV